MNRTNPTLVLSCLLFLCATSCRATGPVDLLLESARPADHLIQPGEEHFAHLWHLTDGGENAEAYFSFRGGQLSMQRRWDGVDCDRIFVMDALGTSRQISNGRGTTTCAYFLPGDEHVLYASTQAVHEECPPRPDRSKGYAWALYPEYDIYQQHLTSGTERVLIGGPGYDAEATVSPRGDQIVFTSTRSGDVELWITDIEGQNPRQVTRELGYDGGAFFSHDGRWLVFRATAFDEENLQAEHDRYRDLLAHDLVRPHTMEVAIIRPDGSGRFQVTDLGGANWAPYFFPDDRRIIFSSNHHDGPENGIDFELFAIDVTGRRLERITHFDGGPGKNFDSFPMFSRDGRYLAFSSNRGDGPAGDTNVFIAEWRD